MKQKGLLFKFALIFAVFTVVTLIISGVTTYFSQMRIYKEEQQERAEQMGDYLAALLQADGSDFSTYQDYFMKHCEEMLVPARFTECGAAWEEYEKLFLEHHPGKRLDVNITFDELDPEVQMAYAIYNHEYYLLEFEHARDAFDLAYTYYITPPSDDTSMTYVLDAVREEKTIEGAQYIELGITVDEPLEEHKKMWEAWVTGQTPVGHDSYDNEYGKTYAYYTPLFIGGEKIGVIGTEVTVASVNNGILMNTLRQMLWIAITMVLCMSVLLYVINLFYINKIEKLADNVREYAQHKDPGVASRIESVSDSKDEISALSYQTAAMILELDNYMKNLMETTQELSDTKERADAMHELAHKDALTGIRNKTAYDKEIKQLEWSLEDGKTDFGIAMIDLNFLKRINDTYGHERGNVAIKRLCSVVCAVFEHSPVFRIGGDEFVVILKRRDLDKIDELIKDFNGRLEEMQNDRTLEPWEQISAAIGYAIYDPVRDDSVENVFKRADKAMYNRKMEMKAVRLV